MTKITIFSGFLGAGKTTLIKKLIADGYAGEKLVLIENEFGEIGIDGGFLKEAGIQITEMNSGCICCSLVGDFGRALQKVLDEYSPDRILIEPSGVGKLSDVIAAVQALHADAELAGFVTVADAGKVKLYMKNFGEFYNNQIEHASAIILSRTQNISEEKLAAAVALLREKNAQAPIVTTPWDELSGAQLLDAMERRGTLMAQLAEEVAHEHAHGHNHSEGCTCEACRHGHEAHQEEEHGQHHGHGHEHEHEHDHGHHHEHGDACGCGHHHGHEGHHHADDVFQSFGGETPRVYTEAELNGAFAALDSGEYGAVLRAKGIVAGPQGWLHFDYVPGEGSVRAGAPDYTGRICVIGAGLADEALRGLFHL
ncbi:MAG: GTP-binding protein [Oscillospiraceae bacterium]|nr:GTP-binding protein [Oscillospiraceae bacterium]